MPTSGGASPPDCTEVALTAQKKGPMQGCRKMIPEWVLGLSGTPDEPEFSRDPVRDRGLVSRPVQKDLMMSISCFLASPRTLMKRNN